MKQLCIIFLFSFISMLSFGQSEYYSTDSSASIGIKLIDNGDLMNSRFCEVKKGQQTVKFTPYEVKEYKFKDGRVYISKEIHLADSSKRVFMQRLHDGNTTLYYYRGKGLKTFFIQKDSSLLVEIPKHTTVEDYSGQLLNLTNDCPDVLDACKLVTYNKRSLTKLIQRYNQCVLRPFPHFKYGFLTGYEFLRLIPSSKQNKNLEYFDYKYDGGFSVGLFIDNPILFSDFSMHTEINFSKHEYSYNHTLASEDLDLIMNISSLRVPLLVRYTIPINSLRPYFNTGGIISYNFNNENALYEASFSENKIEISSQLDESIISANEIGYLVGGGLEYNLDYKRSVFIEIRYGKQFGISGDAKNKNTMMHISSGINF